MKHIIPLIIIISLSSCKKKAKEEQYCAIELAPVEAQTPPNEYGIQSVVKKEGTATLTFKGKITTLYLDKIKGNTKERFVWEIRYNKLCLTSTGGDIPYEFTRTNAYTYTFKHPVNSEESYNFEIADWFGYYHKRTLDYKRY